MAIRQQPWAVALIYTGVSLGVEAALLVIGGLRVPRDNAILAPVVLTLPPILTGWICGYGWPKGFIALAVGLALLTLGLTLLAGRLTGISTGLVEPLVVRFLAGFLASVIANRLTAKLKI